MKSADIGGPQESVYRYSTSLVLDAEQLVRVKSVSDGRETKRHILQGSIRMVFDNLEPN